MINAHRFWSASVLAIGCIFLSADAINAEDAVVRIQNNLTDEFDNDQPINLRVVLVHLETSERKVVDVPGGKPEPTAIGNLPKGHWAVVMTRKRENGNREFVSGGVAAVIFEKTLVALFNSGVDVANDDGN